MNADGDIGDGGYNAEVLSDASEGKNKSEGMLMKGMEQ